ncbi:hypothetical protein DTL42_18815 [Bremerella cremea]|uniref:Uncharacterized protein n=1 Tax=Bremerella cremea TaxID=1031537 RepID=A0A368KQU7_9BACT|nr:hypothetical protein DTL42_18815 [Bremerella cremea]
MATLAGVRQRLIESCLIMNLPILRMRIAGNLIACVIHMYVDTLRLGSQRRGLCTLTSHGGGWHWRMKPLCVPRCLWPVPGKQGHAQPGNQAARVRLFSAALESVASLPLAVVDFREAKRHPNPGKMPGAPGVFAINVLLKLVPFVSGLVFSAYECLQLVK